METSHLALIPEEYREQHAFCFWVHDLMVQIMAQAEAARISDVHFTFKDETEKSAFLSAANTSEDMFQFLLDNNREEVAKRIVLNKTVIPLFGDSLHFIYEGLRALEKRKYTVALSLLRKPLKYNLLLLSWLFADGDDFFLRMRKDPAAGFDDSKITKEQRLGIFARAIAQLECNAFLDANVIYGMAFDRKNRKGLAAYFDMASHPVTTNAEIRTEDLNLNLIFKNPNDTDIYEGIYYLIGYLLMYMLQLEIEMVARMSDVPDWYRTWASVVTLGAHNAVFNEDVALLEGLNNAWADIMNCSLCGTRYGFDRENALRALATDYLRCRKCGTEQLFPLFWLMSKINVKMSDLKRAAKTAEPVRPV